jgi:hypothetical protein
MQLVLHLLLSSLVVCISASYPNLEPPLYQNDIAERTSEVIKKFYMKRTSSLNIFPISSSQTKTHKLNDFIKQVMQGINSDFLLQTEFEIKKIETDRKRKYNLIFIDSLEAFHYIFNALDLSVFDFQGFYLIVWTEELNEFLDHNELIFRAMWSKYIVNVNVIFRKTEKSEFV